MKGREESIDGADFIVLIKKPPQAPWPSVVPTLISRQSLHPQKDHNSLEAQMTAFLAIFSN